MIRCPALEDYCAEHHAARDLRPLRITVRLLTPVAGYDPVHLDGLLAWAVVREATSGAGLPDSAEPYDIPLPLECLWHDADGLPLWASTDFEPVGETLRQTLYWHKRTTLAQARLVRRRHGKPWNVRTTQGRYKEYRIPLPGQSCAEWRADCVGDPREVARLLLLVGSHVGKKRGQGWGAVESWSVEEIDEFILLDSGSVRRPIPLAAVTTVLPGVPLDVRFGNLVGWTPPYWLAGCQTECLT